MVKGDDDMVKNKTFLSVIIFLILQVLYTVSFGAGPSLGSPVSLGGNTIEGGCSVNCDEMTLDCSFNVNEDLGLEGVPLNITLCNDGNCVTEEFTDEGTTSLSVSEDTEWNASVSCVINGSTLEKSFSGDVNCDDSDDEEPSPTLNPEIQCYISGDVCIFVNARDDDGNEVSADYNIIIKGEDGSSTTIEGSTPNTENISLDTIILLSRSGAGDEGITYYLNFSGQMNAEGFEQAIFDEEIPCELIIPTLCYNKEVTCNNTHIIYYFGMNHDEASWGELYIDPRTCMLSSEEISGSGYSLKISIPKDESDCAFYVYTDNCLCALLELKPNEDIESVEECREHHMMVEIEEFDCSHVRICAYDSETREPLPGTVLNNEIWFYDGERRWSAGPDSGGGVTIITDDDGCAELDFDEYVPPEFSTSPDSSVELTTVASNPSYSDAVTTGGRTTCGLDECASEGESCLSLPCCGSLVCNETTLRCEEITEPEHPRNRTGNESERENETNGMTGSEVSEPEPLTIKIGNKTLKIGCLIGDCDEQLRSGGKPYDFVNWDLKLRSGCAGLFVLKIGNIILCDWLWILLLIIASYDAWKVHKNNQNKHKRTGKLTPIERLGPAFAWLIPVGIGFITFVWVGILVGIVEYIYIETQSGENKRNKEKLKPTESSETSETETVETEQKQSETQGKWFHEIYSEEKKTKKSRSQKTKKSKSKTKK